MTIGRKPDIISIELLLIKILLKNSIYNEYKEYIDRKYLKENHRELSFLYETLIALQEQHATDFSVDDLQGVFHATYPEADAKVYGALFTQLRAADISNAVAEDIVQKLVARKRALKLSELAFQVSQGLKTQEELDSFYTSKPIEIVTSLPESNTDLETIIQSVHGTQGYRWRLDALNKSLGSLRKGDFGFVFARPETGKTTFLASEISHMLRDGAGQEPTTIVWFNNEEDGNKVILRVYQAYFGVTSDQIFSNVPYYRAAFQEQVGNRFKFFDAATIGKRDIEQIVAKYNPGLVVYDQIDKVKGFSNDREDLRLGAIYQWARELAKKSHAAIGVCQADGHAEGVRYLTMEHVANAKTAKQAEADFIIGLGRSHDDGLEYARFINISKNKLLTDADSIPKMRHGRFEVLIRPEVARYEDVIKFD